MKIGDLVEWVGFQMGDYGPPYPEECKTGIIIEIHRVEGLDRYTVAWGDGTFGTRLYPQTIELLSESDTN